MTNLQHDSPKASTTVDPRWRAVLRRDPNADGSFVYSVKTTGVYCHPSCGARPPRPENVAFHASAAAARRAGFRPCKRCKPDQPPLGERRAAIVAGLCRLIENSDPPPPLAALAEHAGLSVYHTHRLFKALTGLTPRAYAAAERAKRLRRELPGATSVTAAIFDAGYGSTARFYESAKQRLGMTPRRYRGGGAELEIRYALGRCSLGGVLVGATERGICAIQLGDDTALLLEDLKRRFPRARVVKGDAEFRRLVARVVACVERPGLGLSLPLDIRGTAFQERVWRALMAIPAGTTLTYTELAAAVGAPRAVRAVAAACAKNPLAVAVPCHRVLGKDGSLTGYRWGIQRKRELLARESRS